MLFWKNTCEESWVRKLYKVRINEVLIRRRVAWAEDVGISKESETGELLTISTPLSQLLRIEALLDIRDCGFDIAVKSCFFFYLLYRMNGGCMVFAAEFSGYLREA